MVTFLGVRLLDGVWIGEWVYWPLVNTTRNYRSLTDSWLQSITVSNSRFLATDLTQWRFFSFRGHAVARWLTLLSLPCRTQLSTNCSFGTPELIWPFSTELLFITTLQGQNRKRRLQQYWYCCAFTDTLLRNGFFIAFVYISTGTCLPSRCLAMNYSGFQASCRNIFQLHDASFYIVVTLSPYNWKFIVPSDEIRVLNFKTI
jgi:hypothetical protein